jgi:large subunit ribosomal protein L10
LKRKEKEELVEYLRKRFSEFEVLILTDYRGLNVESMNELRTTLREQGAELRVIKNTLARLAVQDTPAQGAKALLAGPTAVAMHESEAGLLARTLSEFARKNEKMNIKGGVIAGNVYDGSQIETIGRLPGRDQLLALLAGVIQAGPARLLSVISAAPQKMGNLLLALKESREAMGS